MQISFDQLYSNVRVNSSQHESTRVRLESTRVRQESTQVQDESTRVNTGPTQVKTNQHKKLDTSQHE